MYISIHASAKEATKFPILADTLKKDFNPRLREGGDIHLLSYIYYHIIFQSTPPRRRRLDLRRGRLGERGISIHASAKEATKLINAGLALIQFQSTPPRRRRLQFITI